MGKCIQEGSDGDEAERTTFRDVEVEVPSNKDDIYTLNMLMWSLEQVQSWLFGHQIIYMKV